MPRTNSLVHILRKDNPIKLQEYLMKQDLDDINIWIDSWYGQDIHIFLACASEILLNNLEYLIDNHMEHIDINMRDHMSGSTVLMKLCMRLGMSGRSSEIKEQLVRLIRKVLDLGADPYIVDCEGACSLSRALIYGQCWEIVDILVNEYNIDIEKTNAFKCYLGTDYKEFKFKDLSGGDCFVKLERLFRPLVFKHCEANNKRVDDFFKAVTNKRPVMNILKHNFIRHFYIAKEWIGDDSIQHLLKVKEPVSQAERTIGVGRGYDQAIRAKDVLPYKISRLIKMLNNTNHIFLIKDTVNMYSILLAKSQMEENPQLSELAKAYIKKMPKKPKSFKETHDYLQEAASSLNEADYELNQENIAELDGKEYKEFFIKIPKTNKHLRMLGREMNICVGNGSYGEEILAKKINIISLWDKNDKPVACIRLDRYLNIVESKGINNAFFNFDFSVKEFLEEN